MVLSRGERAGSRRESLQGEKKVWSRSRPGSKEGRMETQGASRRSTLAIKWKRRANDEERRPNS